MAAGRAIDVPSSPERSFLGNDKCAKISGAASFDIDYISYFRRVITFILAYMSPRIAVYTHCQMKKNYFCLRKRCIRL